MPSGSSTETPRRVRTDGRAYYLANRERKLAYARAYRAKHPEKTKAETAKWKAENPEKRREYVRASMAKQRYGVTRQHFQAMMDAQSGRCAICSIEREKLSKNLSIDHDHKTGVVRGLVCQPCNLILGYSADDIEVLKSAIAYLERHRG